MKKEDLIALGIDEEVAKSVMTLHGKNCNTTQCASSYD